MQNPRFIARARRWGDVFLHGRSKVAWLGHRLRLSLSIQGFVGHHVLRKIGVKRSVVDGLGLGMYHSLTSFSMRLALEMTIVVRIVF